MLKHIEPGDVAKINDLLEVYGCELFVNIAVAECVLNEGPLKPNHRFTVTDTDTAYDVRLYRDSHGTLRLLHHDEGPPCPQCGDELALDSEQYLEGRELCAACEDENGRDDAADSRRD